MNKIQKAAKAAIKLHGSVRRAAKALEIDFAYLHRLATGAKTNPSDKTAGKLGLHRRWTSK
jgi:hypothetical protein